MIVRLLVFIALLGFTGAQVRAQAPAGPPKPVEENYKTTCQACHMADGNAALEPMNFADGKWKHGTTVKELSKVISDGVPGTAMMPFKTRFSQAEIVALAKYVRAFDKKLKPEGAPRKKTAAKASTK